MQPSASDKKYRRKTRQPQGERAMMTREDNERLCRVDPGAPMHDAFKRYWLVAGLSENFPNSDSDPVRSTMLGEDYVLFRDSNGQMGCLREQCCHRGASLCLGRVEEGGIRCIYHGWKFDVAGRAIDMPNTTDEKFKSRYRQPSFPVVEKGGMIWVYLGPKDKQPAEPDYLWLHLDPAHSFVAAAVFDANFTQVVDGGADSSHLTILHQDALSRQFAGSDSGVRNRLMSDTAPAFAVEPTEFGQFSAAIRTSVAEDGSRVSSCRSSAFVAPSTIIVTGGRPDAGSFAIATPVSSTRTIFYLGFFNTEWRAGQRDEMKHYTGLDPETLDRLGSSVTTCDRPDKAGRANNWMQDRAAMRSGERFTGLSLFIPEDIAVAESTGAIYDRSEENLVPADQAIVRIRRIMLDMANDVQEGRDPIGVRATVDTSDIYCREVVLAEGEDWRDAALPPAFRPRVPQPA
jgi:phthalate 4,5-dioxygenase